jgi:hypothetical protein
MKMVEYHHCNIYYQHRPTHSRIKKISFLRSLFTHLQAKEMDAYYLCLAI